jgi:peptidoglycan hydrolase CwlO-like protein
MRSRRLGRTFCRAIAATLAFVMMTGTSFAGVADTKSDILGAQRRLKSLERQISSEQSRVLATQRSMNALAAKVGSTRRVIASIEAQIARTLARIAEVQARYAAIREEIDRAARQTYMRGPGYGIEALMSMDSISDASYVIAYTNAITRHNAGLAEEARMLQAQLQKRQRQESALRTQRREALKRLTVQQDALTETFFVQQGRIANLARARVEAATLLVQLREKLRLEEIAAAEAALARGTPMTFGQWAEVFLRTIHAPVQRNNLVVMVAWQAAEYTLARWNPLATTYYLPGSTQFNSSRVRNYVSLSQGLEATIKTLRHTGYGYEQILADLARNADPMTTAEAINASRWCRGCANGGYVVDLIPSVEKYYDRYANGRA